MKTISIRTFDIALIHLPPAHCRCVNPDTAFRMGVPTKCEKHRGCQSIKDLEACAHVPACIDQSLRGFAVRKSNRLSILIGMPCIALLYPLVCKHTCMVLLSASFSDAYSDVYLYMFMYPYRYVCMCIYIYICVQHFR